MPDVKQLVELWESRGAKEKEEAPLAPPAPAPDTLTDAVRDDLSVDEKERMGGGTHDEIMEKGRFMMESMRGEGLAPRDEKPAPPQKMSRDRMDDYEKALGPMLGRKRDDQITAERGGMTPASEYASLLEKRESMGEK